MQNKKYSGNFSFIFEGITFRARIANPRYRVLLDAMKAYDEWSKDKDNEGKEFRYEINSRPNK